MIRVLIADDNREIAEQIKMFLVNDENIEVVKIAKNGQEAIDFYFELHPNILIIDIDMPVMTGRDVVNYLCEYSRDERVKCNIIVVSGHIRDIPLNHAAKVFHIIEKPFDYNLLMKSVYKAYELINENKKDSQIEGILVELQFDFSRIGTQYLFEMAKYAMINNFNFIEEIYEYIAKKYSTSSKKVRWNIENSINYTYRNFGVGSFIKLFKSYDGRKPTPKYLLALILNKVK